MEMTRMRNDECPMTKGRAFTLIEVLVVMAIVATLVALLVVAFSTIQERARITQDMNNLRQIAVATQTYLNDNDGAFFLPSGGATPWMKFLHPKYLSNWKIFQSPFDKRPPAENDTTSPVSYGFNANAKSGGAALLSEKITNPSAFILFAPAQTTGLASALPERRRLRGQSIRMAAAHKALLWAAPTISDSESTHVWPTFMWRICFGKFTRTLQATRPQRSVGVHDP